MFYGSLFVLLAIVLSVLLPSDYPFGIFWPLYCLSCFRPITPLVSFDHCIVCPASVRLPLWYLLAIVLSVLLPSDYPFGIFKLFWHSKIKEDSSIKNVISIFKSIASKIVIWCKLFDYIMTIIIQRYVCDWIVTYMYMHCKYRHFLGKNGGTIYQ